MVQRPSSNNRGLLGWIIKNIRSKKCQILYSRHTSLGRQEGHPMTSVEDALNVIVHTPSPEGAQRGWSP